MSQNSVSFQIPRSLNTKIPAISCRHHDNIKTQHDMDHEQLICSINLIDEKNVIGERNNLNGIETRPILTFTIDILLKNKQKNTNLYNDYEIVLNGLCSQKNVRCDGILNNIQITDTNTIKPQTQNIEKNAFVPTLNPPSKPMLNPPTISKTKSPIPTISKNESSNVKADLIAGLNFNGIVTKGLYDPLIDGSIGNDEEIVNANSNGIHQQTKERCDKIADVYTKNGRSTIWFENKCIPFIVSDGLLSIVSEVNTKEKCYQLNELIPKQFKLLQKTKNNNIEVNNEINYERSWVLKWNDKYQTCNSVQNQK